MTERDRQIETLLAQVESDKVGFSMYAKREVVYSPDAVLADLALFLSVSGQLYAKLYEVCSMEAEKQYTN